VDRPAVSGERLTDEEPFTIRGERRAEFTIVFSEGSGREGRGDTVVPRMGDFGKGEDEPQGEENGAFQDHWAELMEWIERG
jgi:hypothetical protein